MGWRHTIVYDDSLNMLWRYFLHASRVDWRHSQSKGKGVDPSSCSFSMKLALQAGGHVRLHTDTPQRNYAQLTLQFWARAVSDDLGYGGCSAPRLKPTGWTCGSPICIAIWKSWAGEPSALMLPLCAFGTISRKEWKKFSVPASAFAHSYRDAFDEVACLFSPRLATAAATAATTINATVQTHHHHRHHMATPP